jgi:hypothetical protein
MGREFKAGDVAMVNGQVCIRRGQDQWEHGDERAFRYHDHPNLEIRPLVVLDPEDREQVKRLLVAILAHHDPLHPDGRGIVAALRSLIAPPRPEEPTGLGAVVEASSYTDDLRPFVRCASESAPWMDERGNGHDWSELDVERVLSEGVTE